MNLDLNSRETLVMAFGFFGLTAQLAGSFFGLPVSEVLSGGFFSLILGSIGVGAFRSKQNGKDSE